MSPDKMTDEQLHTLLIFISREPSYWGQYEQDRNSLEALIEGRGDEFDVRRAHEVKEWFLRTCRARGYHPLGWEPIHPDVFG